MSDNPGPPKYDLTDFENAWGRITQLVGVPWDASAAKVMDEIRKYKCAISVAHNMAASAAMECGMDATALFERLAEIEKVTR